MGLALGLGKGLQYRNRVVILKIPVLSVNLLTITIEKAATSKSPSLTVLGDQITIN